MCIKQKKVISQKIQYVRMYKKKIYSCNFGLFLREFMTIFVLLPGSGSTFPKVDPNPAK